MRHRCIARSFLLLSITLLLSYAQMVSAQNRRTRSSTSNSTAAPAAQKAAAPTTTATTSAAADNQSAAQGQEYLSPLEREVLDEVNLARTQPAKYAAFVEEWRQYYNGKRLVRPGRQPITTWDGIAALDECVNFLRTAQPLPPLQSAKGLHLAALDHATDLSTSGIMGHRGSDGSLPDQRVERFGRWLNSIGEAIVYDVDSARAMVISLLIDDGTPGRGHRMNIFDPSYTVAGVAVGSQASPKAKCVIDLVGGFREGSADGGTTGSQRTRQQAP